ncbi:MAG: hypothetical protein HY600_04055 [Candidatus Omnitrophica bacterium]|nr:hypothetical protein [Candidatus Omnitrophota bacterium]
MLTSVRWLYVVAGALALVSWGVAVSAGRPVIASLLWGVGWMCLGLSVGVVDFTALARKPGQ